MAGHSKWANIKHKKAAVDAKRGKAFSKIAKEITVAARIGGGDPAANISLRPLLAKARAVNMPADNIDRAIKKGTGEGQDGVTFDEIVYEGYSEGVGIIVKCLTENKNRTAAEVRHCFNKANNNLGQSGSVSRSFQRRGLITFSKDDTDEEELMMAALEAGADDIEDQGETFVVNCDPSSYPEISDALEQAEFKAIDSEITLVPDLLFEMTEVEKVQKVMGFIEALEDLDDVQNVYTNMDVPDEIADQLGEE
ncbi:YebC/PmpR family DNA-binding transcriptional regulator [Kiritimatiellaeota bacterium B1221]|nr:YebC/PmpR family DNA-binding transcriptional regulator [Kiritimatiellaeota bacterium B1221]